MFALQKRRTLRVLQFATAFVAALLSCATPAAATGEPSTPLVHALKITVLVTNVAGDPRLGDGEWGYSALVEADGYKILYDTGASPNMVIMNAKALHIDLSDVEDVVLSEAQ